MSISLHLGPINLHLGPITLGQTEMNNQTEPNTMTQLSKCQCDGKHLPNSRQEQSQKPRKQPGLGSKHRCNQANPNVDLGKKNLYGTFLHAPFVFFQPDFAVNDVN
jgi:hypothetical protein